MKKTSIQASILASIPVLLFGINWLLEYVDLNLTFKAAVSIFSIASMFFLLGIGWVKNFPKWSVYSIGFCLLISLMLMNISSPSLDRTEVWGVYGLIPLVLTLIISLTIHFSLEPLKQLIKQIKEDFTTLLFILYGSLPLILWIEFDEIQSISAIPYIIILTVLTAAGVVVYLTSTKKLFRILTIIIATIVTNAISLYYIM
jgi:hypothetical protein